MKQSLKLLMFPVLLLFIACSKGEEADVNNPDGKKPDPVPVESVTYQLLSVRESGVSGTAKLIRNSDGTSTIYIELVGAQQGHHPAAVHFNSLEEGGDIAITLNNCECMISETIVTKLDNGTNVSFDQLMTFDGYLNIYQGTESMDNIIAHANIGSNAF